MICGSGGSKSRLAKAEGAEPAGQMRDEKLHAVVARSTFPSQNAQNTPGADHFWQLRCRKSARHCGAKHISKSKCTKHASFGPLLLVEMSKKCTPLWREDHFWRFRCRFASLRVTTLHYTLHYTTLHYTPQHYSYNYRTTQLDPTTLHYTKLHYTTPHYTTLHYTTLYAPLHYCTLHYTPQNYNYNYTTTLHYTPLH